VATKVRELMAHYGSIRSVTIRIYEPTRKLYLAEGCQYWIARATKGVYTLSDGVEMVAAHTIGARGLRMEIGAEIPLQVGDIALEVYYAGIDGYQLAMMNVGDLQLAAPRGV